MKIDEIITEAVKQRLDATCWKGKKIGNPKTKMKGGVRVNNCVPNEGVAEDKYDDMLKAMMKKDGKRLMKKYSADVKRSKDIESGKELNKLVKKNPNVLKTYSDAVKKDKELGVAEGISEDIELDQDFDMIEEMVESWAEVHGVDSEVIWEDLELVEDEDLLAEAEAWQTKKGKNKNGGLNKKGVASYRRSHPGSKIQTAVTAKPSKLKKGSKAAKRRLSFCRRMRGMKKHRTSAKTARDPNSNINKSLRRWHC